MRDTSSRRERIIDMLRRQGSVQVLTLSETFAVSTQTIRKDLEFLAKRGIATRSYGGALLNDRHGPHSEAALELKQQRHTDEKGMIGKLAASYINAGESVILDSGTTTFQIAANIDSDMEIVVVTNDFGILSELTRCEKLQLIMLGGSLRRKNMAFYGAQAEYAMKNILIDKLFLGVDGFHMEKGITTHFEPEASLNRMMCQAANEVIVVTDSSKFGRICLHKIADPIGITRLITDSNIPPEMASHLRSLGVDVVTIDRQEE
ncbi:transcriptional repressor AgaR [Pseudokordiimonas caeni]|uniref:transcriptional repressor AgaR n=1 Tax=Pseudokordiimonas caeni TaxID=2997908 RepID=UPI002810B3EB|nr:transcriptional repressor AgaR [Pseudokordiimonas caeni]